MDELRRITMPRLINVHDHLRDEELMLFLLSFIARGFAFNVAEPNLVNPILQPKDMIDYHDRVSRAIDKLKLDLVVYFLFQVTEDMKPATVRAFRRLPYCLGGKSYYYKTTTNSEHGIKQPLRPKPVYLEMREEGFMSQHHGEMPRSDPRRISWARSEDIFFREVAPRLVDEIPGLDLDFQHLSTETAVNFVIKAPDNVTGGFTIIHMEKTMDDVEGHLLRPDLFMKPHPKDYHDLDAIEAAILSGNRKFHPTPDNAPHIVCKKLSFEGGCAGGFSSPVIPERFVQWFADRNALDERLLNFLCYNAYRTYGLPVPTETITFVEKTWDVPKSIPSNLPGPGTDLVPHLHGEKVTWQIEGHEDYYARL